MGQRFLVMTPEELLRQYAEERNDEAFGGVVVHYTALVYGLALRRCGQPEMAAEIAQDVFLACARKASALSKAETPVGAWLHRATLLETMNHMRKEAARRRRMEAFEKRMPPIGSPAEPSPELDGHEHLDEAMNRLSATDRTAVLLRFYSGRTFPEMGEAMGCTGEAARKLCDRAVRKLGILLERRCGASSAALLTAALPVYRNSLYATVPPGLSTSITEGVVTSMSLKAVCSATTWTTFISVMKLPTSTILGVLLIVPAGWYWLVRQSPGPQLREAAPNGQEATPGGISSSESAPEKAGRRQSQLDPLAPTETAVRELVGKLLELRPKPGTGHDYDTATFLEREQIRNRMRTWPPGAVRSALNLLLTDHAAGRRSLTTAESILSDIYAEKAPAEAAVLGMALLERDPLFRRAAHWSAAEWFRTAPEAARKWRVEQENSGQLESGGVEDVRRNVMREAEITGLALRDRAEAQGLIHAADPDTSFRALSALIGRGDAHTANIDFQSLAMAIPDPATSGRLLGLRARSGTQPRWEAESAGSRLAAAIPDGLPAEVRQAALVEGSMVGGARESLATLIHASSDQTRAANLEVISQRLIENSHLNPVLLEDPLLAPWNDTVAAAIAQAWQNIQGANSAHAVEWTARISGAAAGGRFESSIQNYPDSRR